MLQKYDKRLEESCVWNENLKDFDCDEEFTMSPTVYSEIKVFETYSTEDILNNKINIADIVNNAADLGTYE